MTCPWTVGSLPRGLSGCWQWLERLGRQRLRLDETLFFRYLWADGAKEHPVSCKDVSTTICNAEYLFNAFQRIFVFTGWVQFSAILAWPTVTFFHSLYRFSDSSFSEMGELRKSFIGRKQQLCFSLHSSKISDTKSDVNSLRHIATPQLTSKSFKHCHFDSLTFPRCLSHSCRQSSSWKREDNKDFSIPLPHSQRGQPCQQPNRCFSTPFRTCWCHEPGAATSLCHCAHKCWQTMVLYAKLHDNYIDPPRKHVYIYI